MPIYNRKDHQYSNKYISKYSPFEEKHNFKYKQNRYEIPPLMWEQLEIYLANKV